MLFTIEQLRVPGAHWTWSAELSGGQLIGLCGPSGCGKTRLLRALADLDAYTGQVRLQHTPASAMAPTQWRKQVGFLANDSAWWLDHIAAHFPTPVMDLDALGLPADILQRRVHLVSSGEKQRLALLRLLSHQPDVLLLDEPTSNLDEATAMLLEQYVMRWLNPQRLVLWVSHQQTQIDRLMSRVFTFQHNAIIETACR